MSSQTLLDPVSDALSQLETRCVSMIGFTILLWDHFITFSDEVELVWKQKKAALTYLFLFNRYFTPLVFSVQLCAFFSPIWTLEICKRFVRFEGITFSLNIYVVALMMMLRVKAMYTHKPWIHVILTLYIVLEVGITAYLLVGARAVTHVKDSGATSCTMVYSDTIDRAGSSAPAWMPLLYDSVVLILTLSYILPRVRSSRPTHIVKRLLEDGILYYVVIFGLALSLTLMISTAPEGIQNITAQLEQLVTVTMMSRITLNLKKVAKVESIRVHTSVGTVMYDVNSYVSDVRTQLRFLQSTSVMSFNSVLEVLPQGQKDRRPSGSSSLPMDQIFPVASSSRVKDPTRATMLPDSVSLATDAAGHRPVDTLRLPPRPHLSSLPSGYQV